MDNRKIVMSSLLIAFLLMFGHVYSQKLIPAAEKVKIAYEKLSIDTNSKKFQQDYITAFPSDTRTFLSIFQTEKFDQLYHSSDLYMTAFYNCAESFPSEVISKCLDIGKNLVWDADAVGILQHMSVILATSHLQIFIAKFNILNKTEQDSLITFYADAENHSAYFIYPKLIETLKAAGENELASKFEVARTKRMKQKNY